MLSVLYGLGVRVVNRPTPQGLAGRLRSHAEWLALAGRAGLRTQDYREDDLDGISTSGLPDGHGAPRHRLRQPASTGRRYPLTSERGLSPWRDWRRLDFSG